MQRFVDKMFFIFISLIFIANGACGQISDDENCEPSELNVCLKLVPRTPVGLPRNKAELDAHCGAYHTGMTCMDSWIRKCLPTDEQRLVQQQIGGARALMRFLCKNDTALRKEFLKEPVCWSLVSGEWSRCVNELQTAVQDVAERSQLLAYVNRNAELCCAREAFVSCAATAGRVCSASAAALLRRMAWVLAQDVAVCSARARCSAESNVFSYSVAPLPALLLYIKMWIT